MPQILAIPALLGATTGSIATGAGVGTSLSAFTAIGGKLLSSLVLGGLSVGLSLLLRPPVPEPASGSIETQQAVPPRTFIYGRMEVAGSIAFKEQGLPPYTGQMWKITLLHDGEVDAFETIKADDNICLLDAMGWVTNAFIQGAVKHVQIFLHNGADDQAADASLMTAYPDLWTADHRLRGIAYIVAVFWGTSPEDFMGAYPNSEPVIKAVIRGRRVFDPRDPAQTFADPTTWMWSDNPALCCLDWIAGHPKGYRIAPAKLDVPSFVIMANRCDELVPLTSGVSEKRYRVATQVSLKEARTDVLARLREACDAHLYLTGEGKWALRGGEWTEPDVTLDVGLGHILDLEMRDGMDALTRYNELSLRYRSPDHQYGEAECDPWQAAADPEFVVGKVKTRPLDLLQVPSYTQARRLAKLMMAFDNPTFAGRTTANFYGLNAVGERNIALNWSEPGEDIDGPFWVEPDLELGADGATVTMNLRAADPTAYDWDPETEEGEAVPLLPPVDLVFEEGVPPDNPLDFAVTPAARSVLCEWTPPSDPAFYIARVWRAAEGAGYANAIEVSGPRYLPRHPDGTATTAIMTYTDPVSGGEYDYYLTVENPVGDRNTPVGPLTAGPITAVVIVTADVPDGEEDVAYSETLAASGGVAPYSFAVTSGALPSGLSLSSGGVLSGTPDTAGDYIFTVTVTDAGSQTDSEGYAMNIAAAVVAVGGAALLVGETDGFAADFSYATDAGRIAVKTAGVVVPSGLDAFYQNAGTGPKIVTGPSGLLEWSPHNLFLNSGAPATQSVTTVIGMPYTVTVTGSGSLTGSVGASGVATAGSPLTYVATTVSSTFTIAGSLSQIQMNAGRTVTAYLPTTGTRRYGLAIDHDPTLGRTLLMEAGVTNICLWSSDLTQTAWVKTNMTTAKTAVDPIGDANSATTITATAANATALQSITNASSVKITSVFLKRRTGSGNVDITQDNGTTWATQVITSSWARYAIVEATVLNPTVGIRLATSGDAVDVAFWQCENSVLARYVTSPYPTFSATQTRAADNDTFLLSTIPALGSEYSVYVRFAVAMISNVTAPVALTDGTANEQAKFVLTSATLRLSVIDGGSAVGAITGGAISANTFMSAAGRFKLNDCALSTNGAAVGTDTTVTLPTVIETRYGGAGANAAAANIMRLTKLMIVPRGWNNTELQTQSAVT